MSEAPVPTRELPPGRRVRVSDEGAGVQIHALEDPDGRGSHADPFSDPSLPGRLLSKAGVTWKEDGAALSLSTASEMPTLSW